MDKIPIVEPHRSEDPSLVFIHGTGPSRHAHDNLFDAIFGCALSAAEPYRPEK